MNPLCPGCSKPLRAGQVSHCSPACAGRARKLEPQTQLMRHSVDQDNGCKLWTAARSEGYGRFSAGGRKLYAHRAAWEIVNGEIPPELEIDHLCENRLCINPEHMRLVTKHEHGKRSAEQRWRRR